MTATVPLVVQLIFHSRSDEARALAEHIHAALNDDPTVPGLRIPTVFMPDDGTREPPEDGALPPEAERAAVVLLADDHLTVAARRAPEGRRGWAAYLRALREACSAGGLHRFFPVQLSEAAFPVVPELAGVNFLRAWAEDPAKRRALVVRRLVHLLCRQLDPRGLSEDAPPTTVFVSHTKLDLEREPRVVKAILAELTATQPVRTWFDTGDIEAGSEFARAIERGVEDASLIAVLTDAYASRVWCRREVLLAKQHARPVVVVDALEQREVRSFPYTGNVPVVRWRGRAEDALDLLLRETLRHHHARAQLARACGPGDDVLPVAPELVTLLGRDPSRTVLYPDPPLGAEELEVLARTGVRVETPLQRFAREVTRVKLARPIALSVSEAEDTAHYGLRLAHLEASYVELTRYLLAAGARVAYGCLLAGGYTRALFELMADPALEALGAREGAPRLLNYVGWPSPLSVRDEARFGGIIELHRVPRPAGIDETLDPELVAEPQAHVPVTSPALRYAWARGMSAMRARQVEETAARVVVGGKLGPGPGQEKGWYLGRIPGVLEEIVLSLRAGQPVFLIGAYGGCARLAFDLLAGRARKEMSWEYQRHAPHAEDMRALYEERGEEWEDYPELSASLREGGLASLRNGLTDEENEELAETRVTERMVELVLRGLARTGGRQAQ